MKKRDRKIKLRKANKNGKEYWIYNHYVRGGISFGAALAIVLSYTKSESILWAILYGILSWFYVLYRAILQVGWI